MSKAVVIHHTLNTLGGETTVAIETIESLYELGYEVEFVTVQPPDLDSISRAYGKKVRIGRIKSLYFLSNLTILHISKAIDDAFFNRPQEFRRCYKHPWRCSAI